MSNDKLAATFHGADRTAAVMVQHIENYLAEEAGR